MGCGYSTQNGFDKRRCTDRYFCVAPNLRSPSMRKIWGQTCGLQRSVTVRMGFIFLDEPREPSQESESNRNQNANPLSDREVMASLILTKHAIRNVSCFCSLAEFKCVLFCVLLCVSVSSPRTLCGSPAMTFLVLFI